ncbi:MAG TPA: hypothetical protein VK184_25455 [Nostocaceae cyanobacterium]|nr:hypothetical protein [Nostocaceae cyanobacterium]
MTIFGNVGRIMFIFKILILSPKYTIFWAIFLVCFLTFNTSGKLRYEAYNIPTNLQRPDLRIDGGTVSRDRNGDTVYRFRNRNYLYAAVQDQGYGKVLIYKNNRLIATKYCGDV